MGKVQFVRIGKLRSQVWISHGGNGWGAPFSYGVYLTDAGTVYSSRIIEIEGVFLGEFIGHIATGVQGVDFIVEGCGYYFSGITVAVLVLGIDGIEVCIGGVIFETGTDLVAPLIILLAKGGVGGVDFSIVIKVRIIGGV